MFRLLSLALSLLVLAACYGANAHIVEGVIVEVAPGRVVVDHEEIPGYMDAMVMPFKLREGVDASTLRPGDRIIARMTVEDGRAMMDKIRVTGSGPVPLTVAGGIMPVKPRGLFPRTELPVTGGATWILGEGQGTPTVLTYLYTTCPVPEFCPLTVTRLQGLQAALKPGEARIVAITIDPEGDTMEVLDAYAAQTGAKPDLWRYGRVEGQAFEDAVLLGGLPMLEEKDEVVHGLRLLVLDGEGRLIERYDDNNWKLERVLKQLRTGEPLAPGGSSGTLTTE